MTLYKHGYLKRELPSTKMEIQQSSESDDAGSEIPIRRL